MINNVKPARDVNMRANWDVAEAVFMLNPRIIIKHGTNMIPPPIPKLLDKVPANNEKITKINNLLGSKYLCLSETYCILFS
jgi:hypothetical protein